MRVALGGAIVTVGSPAVPVRVALGGKTVMVGSTMVAEAVLVADAATVAVVVPVT